jgi:hypothetical protein
MDADKIFDDIAADLGSRGATPGQMFGKRSLTAHGKGFACLKGDRLAFRLGDGTPAHREALALEGAELFDPSARERPFKDWVAVPVAHGDAWPRLAGAALDHLGSPR